MKNSHIIKWLKTGAVILLLSFPLTMLTTCGRLGGGGGGDGGSSQPSVPAVESSALYGINATAGVFDVTIDASGNMAVTAAGTSQPASLSGVSTLSGGTLACSFIVTNESGTDMKGVALRIGSISSSVSLVNSDGHNFYNLGDIPAGQNVAKADAGFSGVAGGFKFKVYVTQKKETVTQGVLEAGSSGSSGAASSLFNFKALTSRSITPGSAKASSLVTTGAITQGANTSLKIDSAGNPKVAYLEVDLYDLKYAYWDGAAWQKVTVDSTGKTGFYTSLALTSLGNPRIAYYSSEDGSNNITGDLKFAYCNTGCNNPVNWGTVTIDSTGDVGGYASIALDSAGNPRISYYDFTNGYLKYASCNAGAGCDNSFNWTTVVVDSTANVGMYTSLASDSSGGARISYYDFTNGDLKYAFCNTGCNNAGNWIKYTVDSANDVGGYTSVALDPATGNPGISYYDFTNGDLRYAYYGNNPTGAILSPQELLNTGSSLTDSASSPGIIQLPGGGYRVYYGYSNGSYYRLAYKDTTDANAPNGTNLGIQQSLSTGSSGTDQATGPAVIQLPGGGYRIYYSYYNGTYWQLAYKNTSDANPPNSTNLGAQQLLSTGSSATDKANGPEIILLPGGGYRLYYSYSSGAYWQLAYKDTSDANPPNSANLGAQQLLSTGSSTSDQASDPAVTPLPGGGYRVYYSYSNGTYLQLAYKNTSDANPPNSANLGAQQLLSTGSSSSDQATGAAVLALPGGGYRLYYAYNDSSSTTAYQYNGGVITYSGSGWVAGSYNGVWYEQTCTTGDTATLSFIGTGISWYAYKKPSYGIAYVYIDGAYYGAVNLYQASRAPATVLTIAGLTDGPHTFTVQESGTGTSPYCITVISLTVTSRYWQLAYKDTTGTDPPGLSSSGCCGWTTVLIAGGSSTDMGAFTSLALDASGIPAITYYYLGGNGLYPTTVGDLKIAFCSADCSNPANWSNVTLDHQDNTGWFTSIALTSANRAYVSYYDADTSDLKISSFIFPPPTTGLVDSTNYVHYNSIKTDSNDYPHIAYSINSTTFSSGKINNAVKYIYWAGTQWSSLTIDSAPANDAGWDPQVSFSLNSAGKPRILYTWDIYYLKYAFCDTACSNIANWTITTLNTFTPSDQSLLPPNSLNLGAQQLLNVTGSYLTYRSALDPDVIRMPSGYYRLYYGYYNGTYWQLAYRDTTDTNAPNGTNLGAQTYIPSGSYNEMNPKVIRLTNNRYRIYYSYYSSYQQISYQETTDTNPPSSTNLGGRVGVLGGSQYNNANYPDIIQLANGKYRMYYGFSGNWTNSIEWRLYYVETTDTNPPNSGNLGAGQYIGIDAASMPQVLQLSNGRYRLYYGQGSWQGLGSYYWYLTYRDTTDTNPPGSGNLGTAFSLSTGSATATDTAYGPDVIQLPNGTYRMYYAFYSSAYGVLQLGYKDTINPPVADYQGFIGPSITVDPSGNPRISYWQKDAAFAGGDFIQYAYCDSACGNAANWTKATLDTSAGDYYSTQNIGADFLNGSRTSLALDASARPRLAYYDAVNGGLKYAYCDSACGSAANWTKAAVYSSNDAGKNAALALDSSGNPRVIFQEFGLPNNNSCGWMTGRVSRIDYTYCDANCGTASNWTTGAVIDPTMTSSTYDYRPGLSLSLDNSDKPRAYYTAYACGGVTTGLFRLGACESGCTTSANWSLLGLSSGDTVWWTSITTDAYNNRHGAYSRYSGSPGLYYLFNDY